ncbi:Ppx/GppA phosphatase family protein [Methyloceanibacter caenitepidi]|uniref:Ppx/GppA phosphatase family protein n=1 Tax=Methyloceanibacter caenitepidi TaxID=1384459 RepID=UPI001FCD27BF|nr:Ppx/GppA phosphatase family protein [Methyloceanibacter caenitepidi]
MTGPSGIARTAAGNPRREDLARNPDASPDAGALPCAAAIRSDAGESGAVSAAAPGTPAPAGGPVASPAGAASDVGGGVRNARGAARLCQTVYGALDLGTNNCRLLVAKPSRRGFVVVDAFSRIIRLGEGVQATGELAESAQKRTIAALRICADKMRRRGVTRSRLIATEACRIATNGASFIDRVENETGLALEIVGRETEAKLAVSGCASLLDSACDWALVFDIGGGSSELIWLDLRKLGQDWKQSVQSRAAIQDAIAAWTSLPLGVVNLAERHGGHDVTAESYEAMVEDVASALAGFESQYRFGERVAHDRAHFLGTSGTVTTISGIHLGLPRYDRSRVDGCWLKATDVRRVSGDLIAMSYAERIAQPCIGHERADLVLAGCAILEALLRTWPCQRLRVADRGLREGILTTLMAEDGHDRKTPRRRRRKGRRRAKLANSKAPTRNN